MKFSWSKLMIVASMAALAVQTTNCGKDKKDHHSNNQTKKPVEIQEAKVENGEAQIRFAAEAGNTFCRTLWADREGQWTPCSGSYAYKLQANEKVYLQVREGLEGPIISSQQFSAPEALPAPVAAPDYSRDLTQVILAGNRVFSVPQNMMLVRYATSNGPRAAQMAYSIMDRSFADFIPETLCEKNAGGSVGIDFSTIQGAKASPNGAKANYCKYQTSSEDYSKAIMWNQIARDSVEVHSIPGAPLEFIQASVFTSSDDAQKTSRLFNGLCSSNNRVILESSVTPNVVPVHRNYLGTPGYERPALVYQCQLDMTVDDGTRNERVDVLTFRLPSLRNIPTGCRDPRRPDGMKCPNLEELEYTYVIKSDSRTPAENVVHLVDQALTSLRFYVR